MSAVMKSASNDPLFGKFARITGGLPVKLLLTRLAAQPELWDEISGRQEFTGSLHKDTKSIFIRWCKDLTVDAGFRNLDAIDYPAATKLWPEVGEVFQSLMLAIGETGDIGRVMIVSLKPGGRIDTHVNEGPYADHYDRFHVPLQSDVGNEFWVEDTFEHMLPGEAWWFNHKKPHTVINNSGRERIHFIADVVAPEYRAQRGITFQRELCWDLWDEIIPLTELHYAEITSFPDVPLEPMYELYEVIEKAGGLRCYTARLNGVLVGYAWFFVHPHIHYKSVPMAMADIVFVHRGHRKSSIGINLIDYSEKALIADGRKLIIHHVKAAHPTLGKLLEKRGYVLGDLLWQKRI